MLTGELFVTEGLISEEQLRLAQDKQREMGGNDPIARVHVSLGLIKESDRVRLLGKVWGVPFTDIAAITPEQDALPTISAHLARRFQAIPLKLDGNRLI